MSPAQITILLNYIPLEKTASEACTVFVNSIVCQFMPLFKAYIHFAFKKKTALIKTSKQKKKKWKGRFLLLAFRLY